jgi:transmembrane sensor
MAWAKRNKTAASDPLREAALWRARLSADSVTADDHRTHRTWLAASAAHAAAWDEVESAWSLFDDLHADAPEVAALRRKAKTNWAMPLWVPGAIAAGIALVVAAGLTLQGAPAPRMPATPPASATQYATALGEVRQVKLTDGSQVTLDAQSAMRVSFDKGRRNIWLDAGRARFEVAHDKAHPFVVAARGRSVTALGTIFDVELAPQAVSVSLMQGKVAVRAPQHDEMLTPGQRMVAADRGPWRRESFDAEESAGWPAGRLVFDNRPLRDVAAEMNRYSARKLTIADPTLAATPISGVFEPGDVLTLAAGLETGRTARVERRSAGEIVLGRP